MNYRYSILIQWSNEDNAFLVHLPEFPEQHFVTHGSTYDEALRNGLEVVDLLVESYLEEGRPLPTPRSRSVAKAVSISIPLQAA